MWQDTVTWWKSPHERDKISLNISYMEFASSGYTEQITGDPSAIKNGHSCIQEIMTGQEWFGKLCMWLVVYCIHFRACIYWVLECGLIPSLSNLRSDLALLHFTTSQWITQQRNI